MEFAHYKCFIMTLFLAVVVCKVVIVSRLHGSDFPSCGKGNNLKTACRTIAFATTQAQWNDTIRIDGTDTSRDPYPCSSMVSNQNGIFVNKSLSFKKFGNAEVFLNCSAKRIMFDGRNASGTVSIQFMGLTLINSRIVVQECSLFVESCVFRDAISFPNATAVINFQSSEAEFILAIKNSFFKNNRFPCVRVAGNRPKVEVDDTAFFNNTATWASLAGAPVAVFIVLLSAKQTTLSSFLSVNLTNTSFVGNVSPEGSLLIKTSSASFANRKSRGIYKTNKNTENATVSPMIYCSTKHCSRHESRARVSVEIGSGTFSHNVGGAITKSGTGVVNMSISSSVFLNNSSPLVGGALVFEDAQELSLNIVDSKFIGNSAKNGGSALYALGFSSTMVSILVRNVSFVKNVLHAPKFAGDFPNGGAFTLDLEGGHLKILLEKVSFLLNKAAMGASTLQIGGYILNIIIKDCNFLWNFHDERFSYNWKIAVIEAYRLNFTMIRTAVSGNYARPRSDNTTLAGQPIHFLVAGFYTAHLNICNLQYRNNKGGGIFILLGMNEHNENSTLLMQDSHFENNELFSLEIKVKSSSLLQIDRLRFEANSFITSVFECLALFFLFGSPGGKGNQILVQNSTFENNVHILGRIALIRLPSDQIDPSACHMPNWIYKNYVTFTGVLFRNNSREVSITLRLQNGWYVLKNCQFDENYGQFLGSNIFIGEGSAHLELINSSFELAQMEKVPPNFRGFIYFASSGSIKLVNTRLSVRAFQDIDSYLMITKSSFLRIDNSTIIQCPLGTVKKLSNFSHHQFITNQGCPYGIFIASSQSFTYSCKRCAPGFFSVEPFAEKCRPCPYGGNCTENIAAKPSFWGFPLHSDHGSVNFQQCPADYCCPHHNVSCPYDNLRYLSTGCSGNRIGVLCGSCKPGFTETLFSAQCRKSVDCTDYWFWFVALFYSLSFAFFLLWKTPVVNVVKRLFPWGKPSLAGHHSANNSELVDGGGYLKVIFYFYQVASLVLESKNTEVYLLENYLLRSVIGWFDFKAISSKDGFICPCPGLTVVSKMFLQASQVFAVLFCILSIFLTHGALRNFHKKSPVFPPTGQYMAAATDCFLLGYSTLTRTTLKALNCVPFQSTSRFFYDGNIHCWQWWQKLCGVYIIVAVIPFIFVLYRGSKLLHGNGISAKQFLFACLFPLPFAFHWMISCKKVSLSQAESPQQVNGEDRPLIPADRRTRDSSSRNQIAEVVYGPFKQCIDNKGSCTVYWESVLIGRRLILISLNTFIVPPFIRMVCLTFACAFILAHHLWKSPFKDSRVNYAETVSLTALLVLVGINMALGTFATSGEILSDQERICLTVLQVVQVIILGIIPMLFILLIVVSLLWQLLKICKLCWILFCRLFVE